MTRRRGAALAWVLASTAASLGVSVPAPAATAATAATAVVEPAALRPGEVIERPIRGGETQRFQVALTAGTAWLVRAEQRGVDIVLAAASADGGEAVETDSPLHRDGEESLLLEPAADGVWEVTVGSEEAESVAGAYSLHVEALAAPTSAGERLAAARAFAEAGIQFRRDTPESQDLALAACQRAGELSRALGEERRAALADHCTGALGRARSQPEVAEEALRRAATAWRALDEPALAVHALNELGLLLWQGGDLAAAQERFQEALAAEVGAARPRLEAATRNNLCLVLHYRGELEEARRCYERALPLIEALADAELLAILLTNLGGVHYLLGDPAPALDHYRRALELRRASADQRQGEADVLNNLAALHMATGEFQDALLGYERTLEIYRDLGDGRGEARTLNNLGNVYQRLGDRDRARAYYERALPLRRRAHDPPGEAVTLNNLGTLLLLDGDPEAALAHHRNALELRGTLGHRRGEGLTLQLMGRAHLARRDAAAALDHLDRAAAALGEVGDRRNLAETQRYRAEALLLADRDAEAEAALLDALALYRRAGDPSGEAKAELTLADVERRSGDEAAALHRVERAVERFETLRAAVAAPDLRASYLASQRSAYEQLVDLHMALGQVEAALEVAEAASARSLLDLVQEAVAELPRAIDPELAARRAELERELRIKVDRRLDLDEAEAPQQVARLEGEIDGVLTTLAAVEARLRGVSARYADLTRPPLLSAAEMRRLLDDDTIVLRYALGEERSWLWRLTAAGTSAFELPPRQRLEDLARAAHEALSRRGADGLAAPVVELADLLLAPVTDALGGRRLLVIADGALHYLPFAALPVPGGSGALLLDRHEIVTAPSMSVLALQRRALATRPGAPQTLAIIADPVFDRADHRVPADAAAGAAGAGDAAPSGGFARLRFSRREANAIAALVPPDQRLVALDFAASRETVLGGALAPFRIVHFATHGVLDARRPELSALVLSRVDAEGRSQLGLLGLRDIYHLRLGADLVVLSGCRTALGREVRGEGLVGLTRGFLYAGVPRVLASLWQVDDRATAELMAKLYDGLLAEGLSPGAALRRAQLALRNDPRTRDPYYWSPFVLQGDWRRAAGDASPEADDAGSARTHGMTQQGRMR